ncbi:hypothetical protein Sste5346_004372 [Sporothrix stenoceras]|uniref:CBM-cenC domain-containing protein n=1 Tax=Sporothrix stenoceras TaxID=5173 RepID=A0ABR3Z7V2_9PEZI
MRAASWLALGAALLFSGEPVLASRCKPSPPASSSSSLPASSSSAAPSSPSPVSSISISPSAPSSAPSSSPSSSPSSTPASALSSVSPSSSVASASPSPSLCPNLVLNPNFAEGTDGLTSWGIVAHAQIEGSHTYGPSTDCGSNPGDPATCFESYNAASAKSYTYWNQYNLPVVPGQVYTLSFRYRVIVISGGVDILYGFINGNNLGSVTVSVATADVGVWHTFSTTTPWTAPSTPTTTYPDTSLAAIQFVNGDASAEVRIQFSDVFFNTCKEGSYV